MDKIVIGREAYDKIMYYVHKAKFEISGLGNVQVIDGIPTVTDIILLKQENDPTETEIDGDAIAKALYDHHEAGMEGELKFWWHSHVNMGVFWSATDMKTIDNLTEQGWFIHGVFNKKNEYKCAYSNIDPVNVFMDNLDMEIDEDMITSDKLWDLHLQMDMLKDDINKEMGKECDTLFDELVTDKIRPTFPSYGGYYNGRYHGVTSTTVGKNLAALMETSQTKTTVINQHTGMTPSTGTTGTGLGNAASMYDFYTKCEYTDPDGAVELFMLGYTEPDILYMQDYCFLFA